MSQQNQNITNSMCLSHTLYEKTYNYVSESYFVRKKVSLVYQLSLCRHPKTFLVFVPIFLTVPIRPVLW